MGEKGEWMRPRVLLDHQGLAKLATVMRARDLTHIHTCGHTCEFGVSE